MNDNFKKLLSVATRLYTLKGFLKEHSISRYEFTPNMNKLKCYGPESEITIFHIGTNYQNEPAERIISDGYILMNGYHGKNWIYLLKKGRQLKP